MARITAAGALMAFAGLACSSGMPSKSTSMSRSELIGTPTLPTSPRARTWSESSPCWVGRSKAMLMPDMPRSSM